MRIGLAIALVLTIVPGAAAKAHARILSGPRGVVSNTLVHGGKVWFVQAGGGLTVLDLETGTVLLRREDPLSWESRLFVVEGRVVVKEGRRAWSVDPESHEVRPIEVVDRVDDERLALARLDLASTRALEAVSLVARWSRYGFDRGILWKRTGQGAGAVVIGSASTGHVECFDAGSGRTRWVYRFVPMRQPRRDYRERALALESERAEVARDHRDVRFVVDPVAASFLAKLPARTALAYASSLVPIALALPAFVIAARRRHLDRVAQIAGLVIVVPALGLHVLGRISEPAATLMRLTLLACAAEIAICLWVNNPSPRARRELVSAAFIVLFLLAMIGSYELSDWWSARSAVV